MTDAPPLPGPSLVPLLALGSGIAVADNYYLQPLLALIGRDLGVGVGAMGVVSSLALLGYALGLLLVVPLGDVVDRRPLVTGVLGITTASLLAMAVAPSVAVLAVATFGVGLTSVVAQVLVPYAVSLADDASRGRVAGTMMSGILTGILGARVVAGLLGDAVGWRLVYAGAAGLTGALLLLLLRRLPSETDRHRRNGRPGRPLPRGAGRGSGGSRGSTRACACGRRTASAASASSPPSGPRSRSTCATRTASGRAPSPPSRCSASRGAVVSPRAGAVADRGHVTAVTGGSYALLLASAGLLALGGSSLPLLVVGLVAMDLAVQSGHVASLGVVYRTAPEARSGATTVYMTSVFGGGAIGSVLAASAYGALGWSGVSAVAALFAAGALGLWLRRLSVGAPVELDEQYPESVL